MDPITAALISLAGKVLTSPTGPSQAEIAAQLKAKREAETRNWLIGGGIALGALVLYAVTRPK